MDGTFRREEIVGSGTKQTLREVGSTLQAVLQVWHEHHLMSRALTCDQGPGSHTSQPRPSSPFPPFHTGTKCSERGVGRSLRACPVGGKCHPGSTRPQHHTPSAISVHTQYHSSSGGPFPSPARCIITEPLNSFYVAAKPHLPILEVCDFLLDPSLSPYVQF